MSLHSEKIELILPAMLKARKQFKAAVKDAANDAFKKNGKGSGYATLDSVIDAVNQALLDNEILYTQPTDIVDGKTVLHTRFIHVSGQWIGSTYPVHPVKNDPQGEGSALTYARRYALMALAGIAPEDDDGNAATKAAQKQNKEMRVEDALVAGSPLSGAWEAMNEEEQAFLQEIANQCISILALGDPAAAHDYLVSQRLESEEKNALWTRLDSKQRAALKKADKAAKESA